MGFPGGSDGKESAGDLGSIPWFSRVTEPMEKGMATHSCVENLMARGAWWATVRGHG